METTTVEEIINLPKKKMEALAETPAKTAEAINLVYINDTAPGFSRMKNGKGFVYFSGDQKLNNKKDLERIRSLVIPPAWENVWISKIENGHLQATGLDIKKRKQYKYHPLWNALRNQTKYYHLYEFGKALLSIRQQVDKDLALPGLPKEKLMAVILSLMEHTHIRIGSNFYEKLYGSFGLTTLLNKHVAISGTKLKFIFKGKKGIQHNITIKSKKLSSLVQKCRDIPGKELFQYYDENGERHHVDSGMVNEYIKTVSGTDFTAKDFRTWAGSVHALLAFKEMEPFETEAEAKKNVVEVVDKVAKELGNTRTVCKKYYIHPVIISLYENKKLGKYFKTAGTKKQEDKNSLAPEEKILMKILETN